MPKKNKLATPDWIIEGYDSKADYEKARQKEDKPSASSKQSSGAKTFKIRECPECGSDDVGIVLSGRDAEQGGGNEWECHKCKWKGSDIIKRELTEDELMKYMVEKEKREGGNE
ncbi:MAG: hypothetical protein ABIA78_03545 [archaeon]